MTTFIHVISGLDVIVHPDPSGGFYAVVPALPGCGSQGDTLVDLLEGLDDAIMTVLEVLGEDDPDRLQQICGRTTAEQSTADDEGDSTGSITSITPAWGGAELI